MTEIADPGKFFNVTNYATLDGILSSLEQSLIGVEGKKVSSDNKERLYCFLLYTGEVPF